MEGNFHPKFVILALVSIRNVTRTHFKPLSINNSFSRCPSRPSLQLVAWNFRKLILLNSGTRAHSAAAVGSVVVVVPGSCCCCCCPSDSYFLRRSRTKCILSPQVEYPPVSRTCHVSKNNSLTSHGSWFLSVKSCLRFLLDVIINLIRDVAELVCTSLVL